MSKLFRFTTSVVVVLAMLACAANTASAHATLDHASPRVGSAGASPSEVRLWFTQPLERRFSKVEVRSSSGAVVATGGVDTADPRQMAAPVPALAPGQYKVFWKIISVDSHPTQGDFSFEVAR